MASRTGLLLLACALHANRLAAGQNQWTTNGPPGQVRALAMDPGPAGTLYAATVDGIYRSTDRAESWTLISPVVRTVQPVEILKVDPLDPMTLYAVADQVPSKTLWRSGDGGVRWQMLSKGLPGSFYPTQLEALAGVVYVVSNGIYESEDGGTTWSVASSTFPPGNIVFDKQNPKWMYATNDTRFYRTTDGGQTWNRSLGDDAFQGYGISSVVVDPGNFSRVYVGLATGAQSAFLESIDGGETWALKTAGLDWNAYDVNALAIPPESSSRLFASISEPPIPCCIIQPPFGGLYRSTDGGQQWMRLSPKQSEYSSLLTDSQGRFLFTATTDGVAVYEVVEIERPPVGPALTHRGSVVRPFN